MGSLLRWGLFATLSLAGCVAGVAVVQHVVTRRPELLERPAARATASNQSRSGDAAAPVPAAPVATHPSVPAAEVAAVPSGDAAWLSMQPSVSMQMGPLADDIDEIRKTLRTQQSSLLEALAKIREVTEAKKQPAAPAAAPEQPKAAPKTAPATRELNDDAPRAARPVIASEGDDRLRLQVQDDDIRHVLELLSRQGDLNILAGPDVQGTVTASLSGVTVEEALHAVLRATGYVAQRDGNFIFVGTPESLRSMQEQAEAIQVRVFRPNYVTAADLQTLITPLLSRRGSASVGRPNALSGTNRAGSGFAQTSVSPPADEGIPSDGQNAGGDRFAGNEVVIVRDYESVIERIEQVVAEVDRRPLQVAIEAVILSVSLDDTNTLGVNFELLRDKNNVRIISGTPLNNLANINIDSGGLKFGFLDSSLSAFIEAIERVGDTDVIASPRVMCLNKQRAEILIGEELGYVSTTVTENSATQSVEFLDVGTQLRIRPFISSDGIIRMEVHPELSTGSVRVEQGLTLPDKEVTQVTTNILCPDGCTIVIGGLIREELETDSTAIPFLGSAPFIGPLFRSKTETTQRDELIVLLTPRIVDDTALAHAGHRAGETFASHHQVYADKMSPIGRRSLGRQYLRLARSAWAAGDERTAIRYVHLAIHYDPQSVAAVELRNEIVRAFPEYDLPIRRRLREGLPLWERPVRNYARQGYPWQPAPGSIDAAVVAPPNHESGVPVEIEAEPIDPREPRLAPPRIRRVQ